MSEAIRKSDIQQGDIFGQLAKEIKEASDALKKYDEQLRAISKTYQTELSKSQKTSISSLEKLNNLEKQSEKLVKEKQVNVKNLTEIEKEQLRLEKAIAKEKAAVTLATTKENKELQKLRAEKNKTNKAIRDEIKANERSGNAYLKLSDQTNKAQQKFKMLAAQYGVNSKQARLARREFEKLDNKLRLVNNAARDGRRDVGRYGLALKGAASSARSFIGMFGAGLGVGIIARGTVGTIIEYEQAQANLASVLGTTIKGTEELSKQQQELGATTTFTAAEVAQLQTELAKLGFTQTQIQDMTESTLLLAEATGTELADAATVAGATLRGFGLNAADTDRVVDVMAKSFSSSSLDMEKFKVAMAAAAPVAKNLGFSLEETTAMIGTLTDRGIDASTAGTGLRNVLLDSQKAGLTLNEALDKINNSSDKTATSFDLFGKRGATLGVILAENQQAVGTLTDKLENADGAAKKMADTQRNTLGGALKLLKSAWDGFILSMNEANGVGATLRKGIEFLAKNLTTILTVLGKLTKAFVVFKATMFALKMRQRVLEWRDYNKALKDGEKGLGGAAKGAKAFGSALKGVGLSLAISLVLELAAAWWDVATGAANAAKFQRIAANAAKKGNEQATKKVEQLRKTEKDRINEIRKLTNITENERINLIEKAKKSTKDQIALDIERIRQEKIAAQQAKETAKARRSSFFKSVGGETVARSIAGAGDIGAAPGLIAVTKNVERYDKAVRDAAASEKRYATILEIYRSALDDVSDELVELDIEQTQLTKSTKEATDANQDLFDSYVNISNILKEINDDNEKLKEQAFADSESTIENDLARRLTAINDAERLAVITTEQAAAQRVIAEIDAINERIELYEAFGMDTTQLEKALSEKRLELSQMGNKEIVDNVKDTQKELFDIVNSVQRNITNVILEQTDKRIEALQKEVDAQRQLRDQLTALAAEGNIEAQQSIKATIEAEREKEAEIARLEARKQKVQLISQGLETYLSLLESGESPGTAFAQTVITTQGLISFLSGLQGFWTGTENAPEGLAWTQEKGAEIITDKAGNIKSVGSDKGAQLTFLQKGDKVKNASETANIFRAFNELDNMRTIPKIDTAGNSYDLLTVGAKLDRIENAIKSQPYSHTDWEQITRGLGAITNTTRKGGDVTYNKHYVRR